MPLPELATPRVAALLCAHALEPMIAVRPGEIDAGARAVAFLADRGVHAAVWPMLADDAGRWASSTNAAAFRAFAAAALAEIGARGLVVDLEPPIGAMHALLASRPAAAMAAAREARAAYAEGAREIGALVAQAKRASREAIAAAIPVVLLDAPGRPAWQAVLGTPARDVAFDRVSVMLYTSLLEGWSRGAVDRAAARALLAAGCRAAARVLGPAASVSLGTVGTGAFGAEPIYRDPGELADDVAIARASGVDDLVLFDLGGVLARPPAEAWLDAFTRTAPAASPPRVSARVRAIAAAGNLATRALSILARL